jgi:hypothetical protein
MVNAYDNADFVARKIVANFDVFSVYSPLCSPGVCKHYPYRCVMITAKNGMQSLGRFVLGDTFSISHRGP